MSDMKSAENGVSGKSDEPISNFDPPKPSKRNKYAYACAMLASMTSILLGYDIGVMSSAQLFIQRDLNLSDNRIEILVGILSICALVGSVAAGKTSDWIGRRYTIALAGAIFFVGSILMGFATNYTFLMIGRFFTGIGVGYALMIAPVYTSEIYPEPARESLTSFTQVFINAGILLGNVSSFAFFRLPLYLGWRLMLGVGAIPSIFLALGVLCMPESPYWLVMQGRLGDAKDILDKTSDSLEDSKLQLDDIKEALGIPKDCNDDIVQVSNQSHSDGIWKDLLIHPTPMVRHILMAAVSIHFFHQASGIDVVVLYSSRIFLMAKIYSYTSQLLAIMAVGFVKTMFALVAMFLLKKIGHRWLLLTSVAGKIVSLTLLGFALTIIDHSDHEITWAVILCIAAVLSNVAFFSIGMGPITWVYSSEIFPVRLRAQGSSMGVTMNRLVSGAIGMTFFSFYKAISIGGVFFVFAGVAVIGFIFFYLMFPVTRVKNFDSCGVEDNQN